MNLRRLRIEIKWNLLDADIDPDLLGELSLETRGDGDFIIGKYNLEPTEENPKSFYFALKATALDDERTPRMIAAQIKTWLDPQVHSRYLERMNKLLDEEKEMNPNV